MSVFGIDFGNLNSTVAITRYGGVDIVTNEVSKRETTTIVSFLDEERFIGEQGFDRYVRNAQNTIFLLKRFIGMRIDDPELEIERKFLTCNVKGDEEGRLMFSVNYCDEEKCFYPEQVLAMMLQRLRTYVNEAATTDPRVRADVRDFVITVPSYYTAEQRRLMYQASEVAGLHCMSLINETTASAVDYGIFRGTSLKETEEEGQVVGILDIGYGATDFSVCKFWRGNCKILARTFDRNNGTRDCDYCLYEHMVNEVKERYKVDVTENRRARLRLLQACERLKYLLSANQSAPLNVENLMDVDVNIASFDRATMESLCSGVLDRVRAVIERGFVEAGVTREHFHSIEMIGGGCRIPMLKRLVEDVLGRTPSFTLNASETTARGCAIVAAMLSPKFQVREFKISELPTYPILLGYHAENPRSPSAVPFLPDVNKVVRLLGAADSYPKKLDVRFPFRGAWKLYAFYDYENALVKEMVLPGRYVIGEWDFGAPAKARGSVQEMKVRIHVKPDGLLEVEKAEAIDVYEVEVEEPAAKSAEAPAAPATGEAPAETEKANEEAPKMVKKTKESSLPVSVKPNLDIIGHKSESIVGFRKAEADMHERDCRIVRTREKKNELESYILDFRPRISTGGMLADYTPADAAADFVRQCDADEQWLYEDGENASYDEYDKRVQALRAIGDAANHRLRSREDAEFASKTFRTRMAAAAKKAVDFVGKKEHVTEEELRAVAAKAEAACTWADSQLAAMHAAAKTAETPITAADFERKAVEMEQEVNKVLTKPAPPKPKEEKKEPETKAEEDAAAEAEDAAAEAEDAAAEAKEAAPANEETPAPRADVDLD
ncbi:putative heat shock protein 110 [Leptomonas pyrrhocoris]|uniref:Putative heat shock protein 110 n=1 Tax=Leptomonas pyrrhocoris TaxID=157538 RepID=A0A0M9FYR8_LEPPY|nr:putative heat shock protein 110 [Leptomonas pyrrhocoris]KPA78626.1 putative heat shock protein 110 [Leptomonas pyrrhocoris]|eukprot:XP_015657065.1 putative heat shock protein 110 [Leptomonas pyrrhocoris]